MSDSPEPTDPEIQALLDFEPVPVRPRVNGWDPAAQRAFIALLAATGSKLRAARAIGRNPHGIDQMLKRPDGESFKAAVARAMELFAERDARRIADGVADAARLRPRPRGRPPTYSSPYLDCPEEDEAEDGDEAAKSQDWLDGFLTKYWHKVVAERQARLNGEIVAADFYLRQMTFLEVAIDLASNGHGFDQLLRLRRDGHRLSAIAETPFSRMIDDMRRHIWRKRGEPERPEPPPRDLLVEQESDEGGYSTEPLECLKGPFETHAEQKAVFDQRHEQAAREQVEWEAKAYRDYEERRARDASS